MAPGWFQKAQSSFGRKEPQVQPYQLDCACGARAVGVRLAQSQRLTCRGCGLTLFVLPLCPYPVPKSLQAAFFGMEAPAAPEKKAKKGDATAPAPAVPKPAPAKPVPVRPPRRTWEEYRAVQLAWWRNQLTPLRLIALALCLTLVATGSFLWNNMRTEQARRALEPALEKGREAYAAHDFSTAARELHIAHGALRQLGRNDDLTRKVFQQYREAQAAASLMSGDFSEALTELLNDKGSDDLEDRSKRRLGGQWLLVDAEFQVIEAAAGGGKVWRSEAPLLIGDALCWIELSERRQSDWPTITPGKPRRLIFAATCDSVSRLKDQPTDCRLRLEEQSVVFWTDPVGYSGLVPRPDDPEERKLLEQVFQSQHQVMFGEPQP